MTAKEYLAQGKHLDERINAKIQQLDALNNLAKRATSTLDGMPSRCIGGRSKLEDVVCKIVDLQNEINADIDKLVDTKAEITDVIRQVKNEDYRNLLELRYLCFKEWEQMAEEMHYSLRWTYALHGRALAAVERILEERAEQVCS